ncbi:hypothetical protein EV1_010430 [Malus domestica]
MANGAIGSSMSRRKSPVPSSDIRKDISGVSPSEETPKPCSGCLGRDSFAKAAAKVGPAVVNISAPQDLQSDVAIVKINSKTPLPTAKLGSSRKLQPGDWVIAVGCPLSLQNTVTAGIISCVDRKSTDLGLGGVRREYLQTDCAINPGNSGGPLVNIDGEVIGVNIMKVLAADGLSFAFPIDSVTKIIEHFKKSGRVVRPWVGLKFVWIIEIMGDRVRVPIKAVVIRARDEIVTLTVIPEESNSDM